MISGGLIAQALETYDADRQTESIEAARAQRAEVLERFPIEDWPGMPLDRYALGQADHPDNFCRWMEFRATELGSIKGGSARKHHIYLQQKGDWWFERDRYSDVEEAWAEVRAGFVEALALAEASDWDAIDRVPALKGGPALLAKTLHVYLPEEILPICSHAHLVHFLRALGERTAGLDGIGTVALNRLLLHGLEECGELNGWSTKEMERLLYISDFSPFYKDVPSGSIGDVDVFVAGTIESYGDAGIETRRAAEEDFLSTALREAFQAHGGELRSQFSDSLDVDGRLPIRPDVTWWVKGTPMAVVDAKHKQLRTSGSPGEDAYQMLAYCTALGLRRGYLVYAADSGAPVGDLIVKNSACEICIRTVDIRESPGLLLCEVEKLAVEIVDRAQPGRNATLVALS